ncbi:MAG TPA: hypothetical protein VFA77_01490 [Candidatus Eisenbacteria bacterium]|jgi:hypothetical protein|nr:hypothetical protein [Candidatus Eisenbacteria bacterium]
MNSKRINALRPLLVLVCGFASAVNLSAADKPTLDPHLEPLRPLLEKTWKGAFKNSTPEKPTVDVARWERALNGKAVRLLHSINDGVYGGETLVTWNEPKQAVTYHYFTTAGFMTTGTMSFKEGKVITHEIITGSAGGVSEVRGTSELKDDGSFHVKTEHLKNGEWSLGHEVTYREDPAAKVVFK